MRRRDTLSFWSFQLAGWGAFGAAMAASRIGRFPLGYMIATKGAMALLGLFYSSVLLRPVHRRLLRNDPSTPRVIAVTAVASYLAAVLWTGSHSLVDSWLVRVLLHRPMDVDFWYLFGGTLYDAFAMLAWSALYVGIKHQQALYAERERTLRAEALAHEARLEALRWQLNPHFLFNALNAISTLVVDDRPQDAVQMLARLGDRLALRIDVDPHARGAKVPSLVLQPLVENAVRHGIAPRESGGRLAVAVARNNGSLELTVEDDGPGLGALRTDAGAGIGIGLANTRERLRYLYGDAQSLTLDRGALGGLRVRVAIPYHE